MTQEAGKGEKQTPWTRNMEPKKFYALDPVVGGEPHGRIPEHLVYPPAAVDLEATVEHVKKRYPTLKRATRSPLLKLL